MIQSTDPTQTDVDCEYSATDDSDVATFNCKDTVTSLPIIETVVEHVTRTVIHEVRNR